MKVGNLKARGKNAIFIIPKWKLFLFCASCMSFIFHSCSGNLGECSSSPRLIPCSPESPEDRARRAMANHDFALAVETLQPLVDSLLLSEDKSDAERFRLHPLLAAAYAGKGGFSILSAVQNQAGSSSSSLLEQISSVVPSPQGLDSSAYNDATRDVKKASDVLREIPESLLTQLKDESFGKSATIQLSLYQVAYSIMKMNQFVVSPITGDFDPSLLDNMTAEDAEAIFASLEGAANVPGMDNPALKEKIDAQLAEIDASGGDSRREKLTEYLKKAGTAS